ncbi:DinB family protein [Fictibacillus barbaricus]|uniref:Damage-inducible protein DinB n=1 Tax=Fictibacillus barbaricus TaxID=182136 RepID=A0ABU1TW98_9BACL|nr:DinB family protein [Fictibacillus barbaricus]MDR7071491.1 putative damage-inducible protein DinB [Fictibacillus barbaricus]
MTHQALTMYDYHVWANQTLFNRLLELQNDVYHQEVKSAFPSVSKVVSHMFIVDQLWFHIISGISMSDALEIEKVETDTKNIEEMTMMFSKLTGQYKGFLNEQEDLDKRLVLDTPWAGRRETSLAEMVMHLVTHGAYHRGNITAMLRQMGYASVTTDLTSYWYK